MQKIENQLQTRFSNLVGEVKTKRLFASYGVFKDDLMFLLYQGNKCYLRAHGKLVKTLEELGAARHADISPNMNPQLMLYHYYQLPISVLNDEKLLQKLIFQSIEEAKEKKLSEDLAKKNRIKELVNLSIKHERMLAKVNIYTVDEFREIGAYNAYVRLKKIGIDINANIFLALYGALKNRNVYVLSEEDKQKALTKLNIILDANGLRKIKF